jgi:hypothetical protein
MRRCALVAAVLVWVCGLSVFAHAQTPPAAPPQTPPQAPAAPSTDLLRVFVDCDECDAEYLRQNVEFVDYVRDRAVADLHVLVTTQGTAGGGRSWTVKFIGLNRLLGRDHSLSFTTPQAATEDDRRKEFARVFRIGLVGYAAETPALAQLDVTWKRPATTTQTTPKKDRWNFWVFRINTNGNMNGEQSSKSQSFRMNFSANRTTEQWKLNFNGNGNRNQNTFEVPEDNLKVKTVTTGWNVNGLVVKSLGPKWSGGGRVSLNHSSFSNNDRSFTIAPAVEYDFFPYSESARRKLTVQYSIGVSHFNYRELTVFDKLEETVPNHQVLGVIAFRQPWGSLQVESSFAEHLNHPEHYRATVFGETDVRLFKGFSFNVFGEYERIRDQISLRKGSTSTEEVLLRIRQLATGYSYFVSFGVSYSFGSIFNSIVNTRFNGFD